MEKTDPKVAQAAQKVVDDAADAIKTAAKVEATEQPAPKKATGAPKRYVKNDGPVEVDGRYFKAGEPFTTNAPKGEGWELVKDGDAAAIDASTNTVPESVNLEAASKSALQAVAIMKHVNIAGLDKPELITAIQAAYEPKL